MICVWLSLLVGSWRRRGGCLLSALSWLQRSESYRVLCSSWAATRIRQQSSMHIHYLFQLVLHLIRVVSPSRAASQLILHAIQLLLESCIPSGLFGLFIVRRLTVWFSIRGIPRRLEVLDSSCANWLIYKLASGRTGRLIDSVRWILEYASLCLGWLSSHELGYVITVTPQLAD